MLQGWFLRGPNVSPANDARFWDRRSLLRLAIWNVGIVLSRWDGGIRAQLEGLAAGLTPIINQRADAHDLRKMRNWLVAG